MSERPRKIEVPDETQEAAEALAAEDGITPNDVVAKGVERLLSEREDDSDSAR